MEFITLTKSDPEFQSYLLGTFARDRRALPVETYHAATARERVTFRVVPVEKLDVPPWWKAYLWATRPELWALTLGPAMAAWLRHADRLGDWERGPSWLALIGIFFLHTAVFLFNDVQDHVRGGDRLNRRRGSRLIQKGWVRAADMQRWAYVNMGLAVLLGVPAFLNAPLELALLCVAAMLAIVTILRSWCTRWGLADFALFLLFGPLLTMGVALASFGYTEWRDALVGVAFGGLTLWVFHVRQFENQFRTRPESARSFLGYKNFDQARRIGVVEGGLLLLVQPAVALLIGVPVVFLALTPLVSIPLIFMLQRFLRAASPLSSNLVGASRFALYAHLAWTLWWILALGVKWL